jgi:hypothetical protein
MSKQFQSTPGYAGTVISRGLRMKVRSVFSVSARGLMVSAVLGSVALTAGCSTSSHFVDYRANNMFSSDSVGPVPFVEVGPVQVRKNGPIWKGCDQLMQEATKSVRNQADLHGANAMIGARWVNHAEGTLDEAPVCTTRWGWFAVAGVGGLGPWVRSAELQGKLVFADSVTLNGLQGQANRYAEELAAQRAAEAEAKRAKEEALRQEREAAKAAAKEAKGAKKNGQAELQDAVVADEAAVDESVED